MTEERKTASDLLALAMVGADSEVRALADNIANCIGLPVNVSALFTADDKGGRGMMIVGNIHPVEAYRILTRNVSLQAHNFTSREITLIIANMRATIQDLEGAIAETEGHNAPSSKTLQ